MAMNSNIFENCLSRLNVPLDVYLQLGFGALSYSEKEIVRICLQLSESRIPDYDPSVFDPETQQKIEEVISDGNY